MNKRSLGLFLLVVLTACDTNERCVANCDDGAGSTSDDDVPTAGAALTCEDATELAEQFIETHRACETLVDCEADGRSLCLPGVDVPGTVALSLDGFAEEEEWIELKNALGDVCPCEDSVSSAALCNDAGECEAYNAEVDPDAVCPTVPRDIQTFLAANKRCTTNEDCVAVESLCHVDDCTSVALNVEADIMDWGWLDSREFNCMLAEEAGCNLVADCTAGVECSDQGQCITTVL